MTSRISLHFALDWDGTANMDQEVFFKVVKILKEAGHKVWIVTMRYQSERHEIPAFWDEVVEAVICTGRLAKAPFMLSLGILVHIWMDDTPQAVHLNASQIWPRVAPEGQMVRINTALKSSTKA